ncbi:MAG: sulfate ABC transporter permease [Lachnospira sp.]|nr:sulfate ABC transporter permease [Lachnospira sp.]
MSKETNHIKAQERVAKEIPPKAEKNQEKKQKGFVPCLLIGISVIFFLIMLVFPLVEVIYRSLKDGFAAYKNAITASNTLSALQVTLIATLIAVAVNTLFGLCAAWLLTKFEFRGKQVLSTLIDIPFSISPVIAGLAYIMTFGRMGWATPLVEWLNDIFGTNISFVFSVPGVVLATIFVTFPFVSRELVPVMQAQGSAEEEAAAMMGAKGLTIFKRVTFPHIRWALLYGMILCCARAFGEFGAVYAVSKARGKTFTLPLEIDALYMAGSADSITQAFAVSSLLVLLAIIILVLKQVVEYRGKREQ